MTIAQSHAPGIDEATRDRDVRAAEESMGIWPIGGGVWMVGTGGGTEYSEYAVDLLEQRCTCEDWRFRGAAGSGEITRCKHISRIGMVFEEIAIPVDANVDYALLKQRERWEQ